MSSSGSGRGVAAEEADESARSVVRPAGERPTEGEASEPSPRITLHGPASLPAPPVEPSAPIQTPKLEEEAEVEVAGDLSATQHDPNPSGALELADDDIDYRVSLVELPPMARYGDYELLGRVAYGGMAEIFLAREARAHTRRMLVIKRVLPHVAEDEQFVSMFRDEAKLAIQLSHPNICHVYTFGEAEGTFFLAMEWVNGQPLSKLVRRGRDDGGMPIPVAMRIIADIAGALDYAHRACDPSGEPLGVVHRDVSPQNIMVSYDGTVKLLDFGIAKAASHSTRTEAGVIKGKFAYMSPQQCVGEPIDGRADIFALGVCLFEALAGRNPFRRKTEFETMTRIVGDPTPSIRALRPEVPEAVEAVIARALAKQPERRFQTAGEMQLAIEEALVSMGAVMNASRLGEYNSRIFADDVRLGPNLDMRNVLPPGPPATTTGSEPEVRRAPPPGATELDHPSMPPPAPKKRRGVLGLLMAALILLGLAGVGAAAALFWIGQQGGREVSLEGLLPNDSQSPPNPVTPPAAPAGSPDTPGVEGLTALAEDPELGAIVEPTLGSIRVESRPSGAQIRIGDRESAGRTPTVIGALEPGTYPIRLTLDGHQSWDGEIVIEAGERALVEASLEPRRAGRATRERPTRESAPAAPAGEPGQLAINTSPWSRVYVGSRDLGTTPIGRVELPAGSHRIRLVDRDGTEHQRTVRVEAGQESRVFFNLRE